MLACGEMSRSRRIVLLVDQDPREAQAVRLGLHGPDCRVLVASSIELTWSECPDVVLLSRAADGPEGLDLVDRLVAQGCAVVVLTDEGSAMRHVRAFQHGAWDYLQKPVDAARLARRVQSLFRRLDGGERPLPVSGPTAAELVDLLEDIERDAATGVLSLEGASESGHVIFAFGEIQSASLGRLGGHDALNALAARGDWSLSFKEDDEDTDSIPTARVQRMRRDLASPGWTPAVTRPAFYGPPTTLSADGVDPHAAVTRRNQLPPSEVARTVVEPRPALEVQRTEVSPPPTDEDEFVDEDVTTNPNPPPQGAYEEMHIVFSDEETGKHRK